MYIILESHNNAFFSEISANFQSNITIKITGLLELTIQTKTSSSNANKK